jgi:hypothetical protein
VICVQRFGGALNHNVHFHARVLDGVFHREPGSERPAFRAARRLSAGDLSDVLTAVRVKILGLLRRRGRLPDGETSGLEDLAESSPTLAGMQAASIQGRHVTRTGGRPGTPFVQQSSVDCAADDGFSLHAGVCVPGGPGRIVFEPLAFLERLAALVPSPRAHLVTSHGVLSPASALRSAIVPGAMHAGGAPGMGSPGLFDEE